MNRSPGKPVVKFAIAGLGAAARQIHLPAFAKVSEIRVVGGCDPRASASEFAFPLFNDIEEMLDRTTPDVLAVVTPPAAHYSLCRLGLLAGCHVFCEKPFTETMTQAEELISLSRQMNRWVVVNNQYRFMNIHQEAKRRIGAPEFGKLLFLSAQQTFRMTDQTEAGWRGEDSRRTCKEFGTHVLDLCRFFFDADPLAITARMPRGEKGGPDYLNLIQLDFPGDRAAHITLDRLCRGPSRYLTMRLDGSAACIETSIGGKLECSFGIRGRPRRPFVNLDFAMGGWARQWIGDRSRKIASDPLNIFAAATARLLSAFLEALAQGIAPPCNAADNCRTLALMLAAYESADQRTSIEMRYPEVPTL